MKEFIEKLIGMLEEKFKYNSEQAEIWRSGSDKDSYSRQQKDLYMDRANTYGEVMSIVNQLAEEYAKDIDVPTIDVSELFGKTEQGNDGWIPCSERLPEDDAKGYIVQKTNGFIDILGFSKDAYRLSRYDFYEYKGKKKAIFFDYDSEYGYCEWECEAWQPLPAPYEPKGEK